MAAGPCAGSHRRPREPCACATSCSASRRSALANVKTADFRYDLPDEMIARYAASPRDASRLLVCVPSGIQSPARGGMLEHTWQAVAARSFAASSAPPTATPSSALFDLGFGDLPDVLPPASHLVFNDSAVFAARVWASVVDTAGGEADESSGARCEVLFLSPQSSVDPATALASPAESQRWRVMIRAPLQAPGATLHVSGGGGDAASLQLRVERIHSRWDEPGEPAGVDGTVRLSVADAAPTGAGAAAAPDLASVLGALGEVPLPPYLRREAEPADRESYQTVYAAADRTGSVAAPTAGLHFSPSVLARLDAGGVVSSTVALHVGAGTFKPVTARAVSEHEMHAERFTVGAKTLADVSASLAAGRPIIPVGTTSARVLESLYWMGARMGAEHSQHTTQRRGPQSVELGHLPQWEPYAKAVASCSRLPVPPAVAFKRLEAAAAGGQVNGSTSLLIAPGYPCAAPARSPRPATDAPPALSRAPAWLTAANALSSHPSPPTAHALGAPRPAASSHPPAVAGSRCARALSPTFTHQTRPSCCSLVPSSATLPEPKRCTSTPWPRSTASSPTAIRAFYFAPRTERKRRTGVMSCVSVGPASAASSQSTVHTSSLILSSDPVAQEV